ncbi:MAG: U32 family peptidase [Oscillospiraceae bacterium]|nr:U32 family peptidase [Oscillospiraceae bacterium]
MLELLSPAGSPESVVAAVQNGADAIYLGLNDYMNARQGAKNFTREEYLETVRYCRQRGCKVYVTLNTLVSDRELETAAEAGRFLSESGADAVLVQDLGVARVLRETCPDLPLHASTQMSIHNLAGVMAAAQLGMKRVVLARELSRREIRFIAERSPIELEIFVHGALCFCHSGQCYLSSLIGRRSGNRGMCAQPCRMKYSMGRHLNSYPMSLRDNCLVEHLAEIEEMGVRCVKIEGRMKRPEYTAIVTGIYSKAIREGAAPTRHDLDTLELAFSREGFTDGYFTGIKENMYGVRLDTDGTDTRNLFNAVRRGYSGPEERRVPVDFQIAVRQGEKTALGVSDDDGNRVVVFGPEPQIAEFNALTQEAVSNQLYKTGGTVYRCRNVNGIIENGLFHSAGTINALRRKALAELNEKRAQPPKRRSFKMPPPLSPVLRPERTEINVQVRTAAQLTKELAETEPDRLYVPLTLFSETERMIRLFQEKGIPVVAVLPRIITDPEVETVMELLRRVYATGVTEAAAGNLGHIALARAAGMGVRGDFGLNLFNSQCLEVLRQADLLSVAASFELRLSQVRDLVKSVPTELVVYGRLPCMVTDQDLLTQADMREPGMLSDRMGMLFPVVREFGDRNVIYNSHKLFLGDKLEDLKACGLWGMRLLFTTESPRECVQVVQSYKGFSGFQPNGMTRGLYYRGVE